MSAPSWLYDRFARLPLALVASLLILFVVPSIRVGAGSGDLDSSFGAGGKVITPLGFGGGVEALATQPDGKIIAAGSSASRGIYSAEDFALARYNIDGDLDKSFGSGGIVRTDFFGDQDYINAVALQADGKIVAAGVARPGADIYFGLARYDTDGSLDATFGTGGKLITSFVAGFGDAAAHALVIQPNGKILVGGSADVMSKTLPGHFTFDFAMARYNEDGSLDASFGAGGKVMSEFDGLIIRLALQPDGKIIAAGTITTTNSDFAVARYNPDGSLDASFGAGGKVTTDFNKGDDLLSGLGLQADGKIVVCGDTDPPDPLNHDPQPGLVRYNPNGSLDTTFGSGGKVIATGNFSAASALALQDNGKIIVAGLASIPSTSIPSTGAFGLARYTASGSLDPSFGAGGMITTSFLGSGSFAFALALLPDGRIIAAGEAYSPGAGSAFALARYNNADDHFDVHLRGDNGRCLLRLNSTTGEYLFMDCDSGFTLAGTGALRVRACKMNLQDSGADYSLWAKVNTCALTGRASLQVQSQGKTFAIKARDITNALPPC